MRNFPVFTFFLFLFTCTCVSAQQKPVEPSPEKVYVYAEQMPEFPGGQDSLMHFLSGNIRYPAEAFKNNQSGISYISFVVDTLGRITDPQTVKSAAPALDAEAIRVISTMPNWKPGKQNGRNVRVKFTLPIRFQFQTEDQVFVPVTGVSNNNLQPSDEQPEFPGGVQAMLQYLVANIKYPHEAKQDQIEGLSVISFIVNPDGALSDYKIVKRLGYGTDQEAIRVLQTMPLWKPGKRNGKPVRVKYTLPIRFKR
jgi:TonB family protein